jgi:hypothetical protein
MPGFCSFPENPPGRPNGYPFGAHMRVIFFENLIFKKIFGIILKKSICAEQRTKKLPFGRPNGAAAFFPAVALLFLRR